MSPTDDPIERAFSPLRTPHEPTADEVRAVRRRAEQPAKTPLRRARPAIVVVAMGAVAVAVAVGTAVDRGQPGTFVGEAGAREVLLAAADATRGDAMPTGWQWARTVTVNRWTAEGRLCETCEVERGTVEHSTTRDVWVGDRGEAYAVTTMNAPRAIENAPLMRAAGLFRPAGEYSDPALHLPPVSANRPIEAASLGTVGWIADPAAVPSDPAKLVRWADEQLAAQDRGRRLQVKEGQREVGAGETRDERMASTLVDLATSPQLSGTQKAAAFEALASLAVVTVEEVPSAFADPQRVAVRIAGARTGTSVSAVDRVVVFDRTSFRVVAEQIEDQRGDASPDSDIVVGKRRFKVINGGAVGEQRYSAPVSVAAPGLDGSGKRLFDVTKATEVTRDGRLSGAPGERTK